MKATINNNNYEFVNESFNTYRNWGHKTKLYKNSQLISEGKCIYLNRTWEAYQYQSVMRVAIDNLMEEEVKDLISDYKESKNIKRLSKDTKEMLIRDYKLSSELEELKNKLKF